MFRSDQTFKIASRFAEKGWFSLCVCPERPRASIVVGIQGSFDGSAHSCLYLSEFAEEARSSRWSFDVDMIGSCATPWPKLWSYSAQTLSALLISAMPRLACLDCRLLFSLFVVAVGEYTSTWELWTLQCFNVSVSGTGLSLCRFCRFSFWPWILLRRPFW